MVGDATGEVYPVDGPSPLPSFPPFLLRSKMASTCARLRPGKGAAPVGNRNFAPPSRDVLRLSFPSPFDARSLQLGGQRRAIKRRRGRRRLRPTTTFSPRRNGRKAAR